jgi:uncharacterized membrane protein HdeD (DUF308 family)
MILNPLAQRDTSRASLAALSRTWPILVLLGAISIVAGIVILAVDWTVSSLAFFVGIVLIFEGISIALSPPLDGGSRAVTVGAGIAAAAVGVAVMVWPDIGLLTLAVFFGCYLVAMGATHVVGAIANRRAPHWWLVLLLGLVEIPLGVWSLRRPGLTLAALITLVGIWQIVRGIAQILLAFELRNLPLREAEPRLAARRQAA